MGIHLQCPACGTHGSDTTSPDARWGMLHDELEMERALDVGRDSHGADQESYSFLDGDGRRSFECPCGRALWIADRSLPSTGRWFTTALAAIANGRTSEFAFACVERCGHASFVVVEALAQREVYAARLADATARGSRVERLPLDEANALLRESCASCRRP